MCPTFLLLSYLVLQVDVSLGFDQHLSHVDVTPAGSLHECSPSILTRERHTKAYETLARVTRDEMETVGVTALTQDKFKPQTTVNLFPVTGT